MAESGYRFTAMWELALRYSITYITPRLRDDARSYGEAQIADADDPGMTFELSYDPAETFTIPAARPNMAILREQGINGQVEMAAAFDRAGFEAVDVHMSDLATGHRRLNEFAGIVACGGFSYGDVLGAGRGWANNILFHEALRDAFGRFLADPNTFALGVCNGCQTLSALRELVPGGTQAARPSLVEDVKLYRRIPSSMPLTKPSQYRRRSRPFAVRLLEAQNVISCLASSCCGKTASTSLVEAVPESDKTSVAHKAMNADLMVGPCR